MSKIIKKKDITVLIESTLKSIGVEPKKSLMNEEYDEALGRSVNLVRRMSPTGGKISKVLSIIHDLANLDFKAAKHSITNKEGFNKISYLVRELGLIGVILDKINNTACKGGSCLRGLDITDLKKPSFDELVQYGFDVDKIIEYLNDEDVLEYLENDMKLRVRMGDLDNIIKFLEELKKQYDSIVRKESTSSKKSLINEDFESDVRKAVIEDWDDGVITNLILDAKDDGDIDKLKTIKSYLQELLQTDPDADLATFFIIDIDKFIEEIRNPRIGWFAMESTTSTKKPLINEDFQKEMDRFKKLTNYTFKK